MDFGLSGEVLKAVSSMGFEEPTPIQKKTIPALLTGRDIIGQAQTGTGKTAAFGIPIIEKLERLGKGVQAIILAPTRELAVQAAEEMNKLGSFKRLHALPVYGGTSIVRQIKALQKGVHIVVGTPGRVIDHLERRTLSLKDVKVVVLDEADEMLDMGFVDDITRILKETPATRQTMLFSATMPPEILNIAKRYMRSPEKIHVSGSTLTAPNIDQIFYEVRNEGKIEAMARLIDSADEGRFLVFCHTKREADGVASNLKMKGYEADAMHGDFSQREREAVLKKFKDGSVDVLVATDVAARGLDITDISHVVNYSMPQNPESYVHRVGRTGRAGRGGIAITFVTPREDKQLRLIRAVSKADIKRGKLPTKEEVMEGRLASLREKIQGFIDDKRFDKFLGLAEKISTDVRPIEAVAALLKFHLEGFEAAGASEGYLPLDDTGAPASTPYGAPASTPYGAPSGMARLFMTVGKQQGVRAGDIMDAISKKAGIPKDSIRGINIFDTFTFVEVPRDAAEKVIECLHQSIISGRRVAVAPARPRGGMDKERRR
ncbi:MAG: DEAD/DEAH box helicase [Deltaproteobacteria bacterium]|nr:DEAD/DEAH box helicase [Deltaproteobacteria bacterium]